MDSMIEIVAKALAKADGDDWDAADFDATLNGDDPAEMREYWRDKASAAITAMKHPPTTLWHGWRSVNCTTGKDGMDEFTSFHGDYGNWLACHNAMIASALKEGE